ncbi:MAG: hypothetical protein M3O87_03440 [Candidatus Dormibacteraeota bacterium]|nr:hypothetical protein [Candidatus Dormibacteraeota bacterium]
MAQRKTTTRTAAAKSAAAKKARSDGNHDADVKTVARIEREVQAALADAPVAHALPPMATLRELADVEVQELDGSWTTFGALWAESPTALVFLRHYG